MAECPKDKGDFIRPGKNSLSRYNSHVGKQTQRLLEAPVVDSKCFLALPALSFLLYPYFNAYYPRMCSPFSLQPWQWAPTSLGHSYASALRKKWPSDEGQLWLVRKQWHSWPSSCRSLCLMNIWEWGGAFNQGWSTSTYLKSSEYQAWPYQSLCRRQWPITWMRRVS